MNTEFPFIGWCSEDNHDKVWGYFLRDKGTWAGASKEWGWNCVIFWARRGKAMQFKADTTGSDLQKLVRSKLNKGYDRITYRKLIEIWPNFDKECEEKLMWDILAGKVK